jgi:hypothetical protein
LKKLFFVFSVLISFGVSAGEIYTCTVNGKTVYQGKPCAGKELSEKIKQSQAKIKGQQAAAEKERAEWAARKEPHIGMTETEAEKSTWGYPDDVNKTVTTHGISEQWVYRGLGYTKSRYLYFRNGILTSIQD